MGQRTYNIWALMRVPLGWLEASLVEIYIKLCLWGYVLLNYQYLHENIAKFSDSIGLLINAALSVRTNYYLHYREPWMA